MARPLTIWFLVLLAGGVLASCASPQPIPTPTPTPTPAPTQVLDIQEPNPGEGVPATIPVVQVEWENLGFNPPGWVINNSEVLIPTGDGLYVINMYNYLTWQFRDGTWEKLGRAEYNGSGFQLGNIVFPPYDSYAGIFILAHEFRYEYASEISEVLKNILGEELYNRGVVAKNGLVVGFNEPSESWMVANIARDPANPEIVAVHIWQTEEIGRPAPPTPHLYFSTDNRQTWTEITVGEAEKFHAMHPYRGLAVRQSEDGVINLYLSGKDIWYAKIAP